jgi:hypothetical protein
MEKICLIFSINSSAKSGLHLSRVRTHKGSPDRGIVIHGVELEDTDDSLAFLADEGSVFSAQAAVAE